MLLVHILPSMIQRSNRDQFTLVGAVGGRVGKGGWVGRWLGEWGNGRRAGWVGGRVGERVGRRVGKDKVGRAGKQAGGCHPVGGRARKQGGWEGWAVPVPVAAGCCTQFGPCQARPAACVHPTGYRHHNRPRAPVVHWRLQVYVCGVVLKQATGRTCR
jgi:hypothetical protein